MQAQKGTLVFTDTGAVTYFVAYEGTRKSVALRKAVALSQVATGMRIYIRTRNLNGAPYYQVVYWFKNFDMAGWCLVGTALNGVYTKFS